MLRYALLFTFIAGIFPYGFANSAALKVGFVEEQNVSRIIDEEYERYKKRGDEYFDQGDYQNALRQYRNCLEVPNFENDPYAKGRIEQCQKLLKLREQAYQSLNKGNGDEAIGSFEQMLVENPKDSITKVNLTDYWTREATKFYSERDYEAAKEHYQKALRYATKPDLIQLQIQNSEAFIKYRNEQAAKSAETKKEQPTEPELKEETLEQITISSGKPEPMKFVKPKRRIAAKALAAAVGVGAGAYAYSLNNNYQSKLDEVTRIGKTADPDGDNVILSSNEFSQWQTAYKATTDAKNDRSKFMAALGVAGAAAVTEIILFVLPKTSKSTGISVGVATQSTGLAVRYVFK
ncbi:tetratricopeptide repeat protein [Persicitalea sp.]|uniref:tetratricopeptide repeat protein n=1 Tax=Persicitalea sp. TaxID=3100273 RepID=UPI003593ED7D